MTKINDGKLTTIKVGDASVDTFYYQVGDPVRGDLILMHTGGAGVSSFMCWYLNIDAFAEAGYRVTAPDAPGFGRSVVAEGGAAVKATDFLPAFMAHMGIERAHLAGNSMGGMTACHVAADHPELVASLTVSGGEPRVATEAVIAIGSLAATPRNDFVRAMFAKPSLAVEDVRHATADFFYDRDHPQIDVVTKIRMDTMADPGPYQRAKDNAIGQIQRKGADGGSSFLANIEVPTFMLHGRDEDWFYPDEHRPALREAAMQAAVEVADCTSTFLPYCGHWPQLEQAGRYNALVLEFLDRNS
jgi:2-hydroxy-6-oxonona-2,4-dienedioate hydrolase